MHVLILEDDVLIALDLAATIEEFGATVAGPAHTAHQAEKIIAARRPDLALLDFQLNGHTSEAIADHLSGMGVPVVLITGHGRLNLPDRLREGIVLPKPVAPKTVHAIMHEAFRGDLHRTAAPV